MYQNVPESHISLTKQSPGRTFLKWEIYLHFCMVTLSNVGKSEKMQRRKYNCNWKFIEQAGGDEIEFILGG